MGEDRWAGLPDVRVTRKGFTACDRVQQRGARLGGLVQGGTRARSGVACLARHFAVQVAGRCTGTPARGRMEEGQARMWARVWRSWAGAALSPQEGGKGMLGGWSSGLRERERERECLGGDLGPIKNNTLFYIC